MRTTTTRTSSITNDQTAAFPRTPEAPHQRTALDGDTKEVVLNRCRIVMRFSATDGQWWNVRVTHA